MVILTLLKLMVRGKLHVFSNERQGQFRERPLPPTLPTVHTINVDDANNDGVLDLIAVQTDGVVIRISDKNEGQEWETAEVARLKNAPELSRRQISLSSG